MKNYRYLLTLFAALALFFSGVAFTPSCGIIGQNGYVDAPAVHDSVALVVTRHNLYVSADPSLTAADRQASLDEANGLLLAASGEDALSAVTLEPIVSAVCGRHDQYVVLDPELSEKEKRVFMRTTALLVKVFETSRDTTAPSP